MIQSFHRPSTNGIAVPWVGPGAGGTGEVPGGRAGRNGNGHARRAFALALGYAAISAVWIAGSDFLVDRMIQDPMVLRMVETLKGWLFVAVTAALLFLLLRRQLRRAAAGALRGARAEGARRRMEERQARLKATLPGVVYSFRMKPDGSFSVPSASPELEEIFGVDAKALVKDATAVFEMVHPDDLPKMIESIRESAERQSVWLMEFRLRHPKRGELWLLGNSLPSREPDGGTLWHGFMMDVTLHKQAERSLRESQRRFAIAFNASPTALAISRWEDGKYLDVNQAFLQLIGHRRDDVIGRDEIELRLLDHAGSGQIRGELRANGNLRNREVVVRDALGRRLNLLLSNEKIELGGTACILTTFVDITERKRVEEDLRFKNVVLSTQQEASRDGILVVDESARVATFNRRFAEMWDVPFSLMKAGDDETVLQHASGKTSDPEAFVRQLRELNTNRRDTLEDSISLTDGRVIERFTTPMRGDDWRYYGRVWYFRDVTARKKAEEALRESEARFRQVVETIDEVFWVSEAGTGALLYVSPGFKRVWGRNPAEFLETSEAWIESIVGEDRERVRAAFEELCSGGHYNVEYRITQPGGDVRWVSDRAFPARDASSKNGHIIGVAVDITERKLLEQQFLRAQRLESIGTLAGGVAHDLNNILAPIMMASSLLGEKLSQPDELRLVQMMEAAAQRGAGIIRQLLTFSRGMKGQRLLVQIRHLLKETAALIRETFPRNITIETTAEPDLWPVHGDATLLHQIVMNLCVNARDAMPDGGLLTLKAFNAELGPDSVKRYKEANPGQFTVLEVTDTGEGIPPGNIERIFDPFFTTKAVGSGTGLGLSTVIGIARSHGGFVTVESSLGKGSSFRVHLPADPAGDFSPGPDEMDCTIRGSGEVVLLVDDEATIREAARRILEAANYSVVLASNGEEALAELKVLQDSLDIVVTDIMMPVMGGLELAEALNEIAPDVPILPISGLVQPGVNEKFAEIGIEFILAKPFSSRELLEAVGGTLRRSRNEQTA